LHLAHCTASDCLHQANILNYFTAFVYRWEQLVENHDSSFLDIQSKLCFFEASSSTSVCRNCTVKHGGDCSVKKPVNFTGEWFWRHERVCHDRETSFHSWLASESAGTKQHRQTRKLSLLSVLNQTAGRLRSYAVSIKNHSPYQLSLELHDMTRYRTITYRYFHYSN